MSRAGGAGATFELVFTPDSTAWPVRWPERLMLKPVFGVFRGETRDYVPERTCHMEPDETASHAMCGPAVRCDACGAAVPAVGTLRYCPNCGAKVVQYGD